MRKADIDVAWQQSRLPGRARLAITSVETNHNDGIDALSICSRVTAFIGPNGAGKTEFLKALQSVFSAQLVDSRVTISKVSGNFRGNVFEIKPGLVDPPQALNSEFIDASFEIRAIQKVLVGQTNLEEMLEQYESNLPNQDQVGLYRHVCGRAYDSISFKEVEFPASPDLTDLAQEDSSDNVFPFFEVQVDGVRYDSRSMGLGEFCGCYLIWRMRRADEGSALFLDEPDSHLSPASRAALLDAIAFLAHERKLWIAFTTHSIELLEGLRECEIFLVSSDVVGQPARMLPINQKRHAVRTLGLAQQRKLLIVVEDVDAKEAVWCIVNRWASDIAKTIDVQVVSGGEVQVRNFVRAFPQDSQICQAIACLDGDKRVAPGGAQTETRIFYLPSAYDPVQAARTVVEADCNSLANLLGVDANELSVALLRIRHVDHHDFLSRLIAALHLEGKGVPEVRTCLMKAWLFADGQSADAQTLANDLVQFVNSIS